MRGREWFRDRKTVDIKAQRASFLATVFGVLGFVCAVHANESIFSGGYPNEAHVVAAKMLNSLCTLLCIVSLFHYYSLSVRLQRIKKHFLRLVPLDTSRTWKEVLKDGMFWLEVSILSLHCPPYITDEYHTYSFENLIVYRAETLGALINSVRCYLIWRYMRDYYLHKLPKRLTIEEFTGANFGSNYVFKHNLHGWPGAFAIICFWGLGLLCCGYWYRAAEITACKLPSTLSPRCSSEERAHAWILFGTDFEHVNDVYIWDHMWLVLITSLTVGYGDTSPKTYYGRVVAAISVLLGLALGSTLTAAISNILQWTPEELTVLRILERRKTNLQLQTLAVTKLQLRFREVLMRRRRAKKAKAREQQELGAGGAAGGADHNSSLRRIRAKHASQRS